MSARLFRRFAVLFVSVVSASHAFAGIPWHIKIKNSNPDQAVTISPAGSDCFYEADFGVQQIVEPNSERTFYIEEKNALFANCAGNLFKILGVDVASSKGREHINFIQRLPTARFKNAMGNYSRPVTSQEFTTFSVMRQDISQDLPLSKDGALYVELTFE